MPAGEVTVRLNLGVVILTYTLMPGERLIRRPFTRR